MKELEIPPSALLDKESFEILRVWAANNEQQVVIHSGLNGDAFDFGFMLANLVQHGASLYAERFNTSRKNALDEILEGFSNEIKSKTGNPTGGVG